MAVAAAETAQLDSAEVGAVVVESAAADAELGQAKSASAELVDSSVAQAELGPAAIEDTDYCLGSGPEEKFAAHQPAEPR